MQDELLDALHRAIWALNATPNFDTGIPRADDPQRMLNSYALIPQLEGVATRAKAALSAPRTDSELLIALERAFDILEGIADNAISELAPFETLIRKARGEA